MTFSKLRVAFNIVYRQVLGFLKKSSDSEMYATDNIEKFETLLRNVIFMDLCNDLKTSVQVHCMFIY